MVTNTTGWDMNYPQLLKSSTKISNAKPSPFHQRANAHKNLDYQSNNNRDCLAYHPYGRPRHGQRQASAAQTWQNGSGKSKMYKPVKPIFQKWQHKDISPSKDQIEGHAGEYQPTSARTNDEPSSLACDSTASSSQDQHQTKRETSSQSTLLECSTVESQEGYGAHSSDEHITTSASSQSHGLNTSSIRQVRIVTESPRSQPDQIKDSSRHTDLHQAYEVQHQEVANSRSSDLHQNFQSQDDLDFQEFDNDIQQTIFNSTNNDCQSLTTDFGSAAQSSNEKSPCLLSISYSGENPLGYLSSVSKSLSKLDTHVVAHDIESKEIFLKFQTFQQATESQTIMNQLLDQSHNWSNPIGQISSIKILTTHGALSSSTASNDSNDKILDSEHTRAQERAAAKQTINLLRLKQDDEVSGESDNLSESDFIQNHLSLDARSSKWNPSASSVSQHYNLKRRFSGTDSQVLLQGQHHVLRKGQLDLEKANSMWDNSHLNVLNNVYPQQSSPIFSQSHMAVQSLQQQSLIYQQPNFERQCSQNWCNNSNVLMNSLNIQTQPFSVQHYPQQAKPQQQFQQANNNCVSIGQPSQFYNLSQDEQSNQQMSHSNYCQPNNSSNITNLERHSEKAQFGSNSNSNSQQNQISHRQQQYQPKRNCFQIDLQAIASGFDSRTTVMIKNIPNKYTQKMLLERLDQGGHAYHYDFLYLPIDLKNNCNVGYAFINMTKPIYVLALFEDLNERSWERFNSEKICQITYGRIQGKRHLVENFSTQQVDSKKVKPLILDYSQDYEHQNNIEQVHQQHDASYLQDYYFKKYCY